jgi:hypothetical protein
VGLLCTRWLAILLCRDKAERQQESHEVRIVWLLIFKLKWLLSV